MVSNWNRTGSTGQHFGRMEAWDGNLASALWLHCSTLRLLIGCPELVSKPPAQLSRRRSDHINGSVNEDATST